MNSFIINEKSIIIDKYFITISERRQCDVFALSTFLQRTPDENYGKVQAVYDGIKEKSYKIKKFLFFKYKRKIKKSEIMRLSRRQIDEIFLTLMELEETKYEKALEIAKQEHIEAFCKECKKKTDIKAESLPKDEEVSQDIPLT